MCGQIAFLRPLIAGVLASLLLTGSASAQLVNENLLVGLPSGFKVAFQNRKNNVQMTEAISSNETLQNWTEMVTIQIFFGRKDTPDQFRSRIEQRWRAVCTDGRGDEITKGAEKGYPFAIFVLSCPENPKTESPRSPGSRWCRGTTVSMWSKEPSNTCCRKSRSRRR